MAVPWAELVRRVPPKVEVGECTAISSSSSFREHPRIACP